MHKRNKEKDKHLTTLKTIDLNRLVSKCDIFVHVSKLYL